MGGGTYAWAAEMPFKRGPSGVRHDWDSILSSDVHYFDDVFGAVWLSKDLLGGPVLNRQSHALVQCYTYSVRSSYVISIFRQPDWLEVLAKLPQTYLHDKNWWNSHVLLIPLHWWIRSPLAGQLSTRK